ncbi:MAG: phosphotransferase [Ktedonobacterales bacterium]|nr:phosphotransferase [Ktedonobacterales bacterium]
MRHTLDPAVLRALGIDPGTVTSVETMPGGLSGARLTRVQLRRVGPGGVADHASRILKLTRPESGWLSVLAEDSRLREVRLQVSGLLRDLPASITTGALAWTISEPAASPLTGALLMRDERAHLLPAPPHVSPGRLPPRVGALLDRLARLHARFWEDPRLSDPTLGLMSPRAALLLLAPANLAHLAAAGDPSHYLPLARAGWEAFFALAPAPTAARLRAVLAAPDPSLAAITALPVTLIHGDIWGPNLGWLPATPTAPRRGSRLLLLDWALAAAAPATYDPLWLCGTWHALAPMRVLAAYRAHLERHLRARGHALPPATWRALADAGYLRTALTCGEALGRAAVEAPAGATRRRAEARVRWWATRAAQAAERMVREAPLYPPSGQEVTTGT